MIPFLNADPKHHQQYGLSYSVRPRAIVKHTGQLLLLVGGLTLVPALTGLLATEFHSAIRFCAVALFVGMCGYFASRIHAPEALQKHEVLVIAALSFLISSAAMTYPMMQGGLGPLDAFFEAVSGVTTTGLTCTESIFDKPTTFLVTRSWLQWCGGLGIIVLSLLIWVGRGKLSKRLAVGEVEADDPIGSTRAHFRRIYLAYAILTLAGALGLWVLGTRPFYAFLYSLSSVSTGGFSPLPGSISALPNDLSRFYTTGVCFACAVPLVIFHKSLKERSPAWLLIPQVRTLIALATLVSSALFLLAIYRDQSHWLYWLKHSFLLGFSAQTTTGFSSLDVGKLDNGSKLLVIFSMFVGGGIGSTAGGIKLIRFLILINCVRIMILQPTVAKHAVLHLRAGGDRIEDDQMREALGLIILFVIVTFLSWVCFVLAGYDPLDSLFDVVSAIGTVGLSTGVCGPELHPFLKLVLIGNMLMGRLEIIAWLVLFYPRTWFGRRLSG